MLFRSQANNFELKPQLISLVEDHCSFGGSANEDPNQHLTKFLRISDTEKNPKGEQKRVRWEECKAITILKEVSEEEGIRSSEQEPEILKEGVEEAKQESETEQAKELQKGTMETYQPKAPFPQRLGGGEKGKTYSRFLETFKSLHINIPFLEKIGRAHV